MKATVIGILLLLVPAAAMAGGTSSAAQKKCRLTTKTLAKCSDIGCPSDHHPNLNRVKNRTDVATSPAPMTVADIVAMEKQNDPKWSEDQERSPIGAVGEGKGAMVEGYLVHVQPEKGESCNCYLSGDSNNDFHLNLVGSLAQAHLDSVTARWKSIVTEMTPRVRKNHSGWTLDKLGFLKLHHKRVRLTGWLMLDTAHLKDHHGGARASLWEVHPITQFQVRSGNAWVKLDNYHP